MSVSQILTEAYFNTNSNPANFPTNYGINKLNEIYRQVYKNIIKKYREYFWNYRTTDITKWLSEYAIQRKEVNLWTTQDPDLVPWIKVLEKVRIKVWEKLDVDGETTIPVYELLPELSDAQWEAGYKGRQLKDNHIILNWTPSEDIEDGIKLEWIQAINDLTVESTDAEIFPGHEDLQDLTDLLRLWLERKLWRGKQDFDKANIAYQDYQTELVQQINILGIRTDTTFYSELQY